LLLNPVWNIVNSFSNFSVPRGHGARVRSAGDGDDKPDKPDAQDAPPVVHEIGLRMSRSNNREGQPVVRDFT